MKKEIRLQLSQYGFDPHEFSIVSYGGAGPTHVGSVAHKLDVRRTVIPPRPGINSAIGLLCTDIEQEYLQSEISSLRSLNEEALEGKFDHLIEDAISDRMAEGFEEGDVEITRKLDLRYEGQGYELTVNVEDTGTDFGDLRERFDWLHQSRYGHSSTEPLEVVNYRVVSSIAVEELDIDPAWDESDVQRETTRDVHHPITDETVSTPIYRREDLRPDVTISGPAIVEQLDTTTVIEPNCKMRVDGRGSMVIEVVR